MTKASELKNMCEAKLKAEDVVDNLFDNLDLMKQEDDYYNILKKHGYKGPTEQNDADSSVTYQGMPMVASHKFIYDNENNQKLLKELSNLVK